tara:strand:+ start:776 stop:1132 length:357 start_codon:yes stop_codon:yes gene_type:complete
MKFRSRFEAQVALALNKQKIKFEFEPHKIGYVPPPRVYIPDFYIKDHDFYIEVKGRLLQSDRVKHLLVKKQNPELDIKFLFANSRKKIYKGSKTSHADWADKHGFEWAEQVPPKEWIK